MGLTVEYGAIGQSYLFEFIERMCPRRTFKNNRSNSRELHTYRPFDEKEITLIHHERHLDSSIDDDQVVTSGSKKAVVSPYKDFGESLLPLADIVKPRRDRRKARTNKC